MKRILFIILSYLLIILLFFGIYILLFSTSLFKGESILFYRGFKILFFEAVLFAIGAIYLIFNKISLIESYIASVSIASSICIVFLTIFPVTVDRSVSTFLLGKISKPTILCKQGGVSKDNLKKIFIEKYFNEDDAIGRRLKEQEITGSITKTQDGCYKNNFKRRETCFFL